YFYASKWSRSNRQLEGTSAGGVDSFPGNLSEQVRLVRDSIPGVVHEGARTFAGAGGPGHRRLRRRDFDRLRHWRVSRGPNRPQKDHRNLDVLRGGRDAGAFSSGELL